MGACCSKPPKDASLLAPIELPSHSIVDDEPTPSPVAAQPPASQVKSDITDSEPAKEKPSKGQRREADSDEDDDALPRRRSQKGRTSRDDSDDDDDGKPSRRSNRKKKGNRRSSSESDEQSSEDERAKQKKKKPVKSRAVDDSDEDEDDSDEDQPGGIMKGSTGSNPKKKKKICQLLMSMNYRTAEKTLAIHIGQLQGFSEKMFGVPDLYVKLYLAPDAEKKTKQKTRIIKKNLTPNFDEDFEYRLSPQALAKKYLQVQLCEASSIKNDSVAEVSIGFSKCAGKGDFRWRDWFAMTEGTGEEGLNKSVASLENGDVSGLVFLQDEEAEISEEEVKPIPKRTVAAPLTRSVEEVSNGSLFKKVPKKQPPRASNPFGDDDEDETELQLQQPARAQQPQKAPPMAVNPFDDDDLTSSVRPAYQQPTASQYYVAPSQQQPQANYYQHPPPAVAATARNPFEEEDAASRNPFDDDDGEDDVPVQPGDATNEDISDTMSTYSKYAAEDDDDEGPHRRLNAFDAQPAKPERTTMSLKKRKMGQVRLTTTYVSSSQTLTVTIHQVEGLPEKYGTPDLYIACELKPDRDRKTKRKTRTEKKNRSPSFEEKFLYKLTPEEMNSSVLMLQLCDAGFIRDDVIGKVSIGFRSFYSDFEWSDWFALSKKMRRNKKRSGEATESTSGEKVDDNSDAKSISEKSISERSLAPSEFSFATTRADAARYLAERGQIRLAIRYESKKEILHVLVKDARDLATSEKGTSSTYVKLYLLPDPKKKSKQKTSVSTRPTNPVWDQSFEYHVLESDYHKKKLQVTVADKSAGEDKMGFMGQVTIDLSEIPYDTPQINWYDLGASDLGHLRVKIEYDANFKRLIVLIREAKGVPPSPGKLDANPYIKLYLTPDKKKTSKRKTKVHKNTTRPQFNESFVYDLQAENLEKTLELSLWNYYSGTTKNEPIGVVYIPVKDVAQEGSISQWFQIQRPPEVLKNASKD